MPTFEIYSLGDGAYLAAVLNAVAMLTGTANFTQLVAVGFLFGTFLVVVGGLLQARGPQFHHLLVALVLYAALFGPSARVVLEDLRSGAVRTVDNVPIGVAFMGSAMSQIGYGTTRLFEQAFATPRMTEVGFATPLQLLQDLRRGTLSLATLGAANSPTPGADMERTLTNYFNECVLYALDIQSRTRDEVLRNPDWTIAFASSLRAVTTELHLGGAPLLAECADAWAQLRPYLTTHFLPAVTQAVAQHIGESPANTPAAVQAALDAIAGAGIDAQNYMLMAAMVPMLDKANIARANERMDFATAASIMQAVQQRNTQWAAEATLFERIMTPMMTFFEAFLFAVSPLMAFAIGLGPMGIKMVGKWLLFGLWIQLWQPVLAVLNLYVIMAARGEFDAMRSAGLGNLELPSVMALWQTDLLLADYLGTAGMLMASTPAITLMLIYGSAVTATHLAGRLQGSDFYNEKQLSPDVSAPAAAMRLEPLKTNAPTTGTITTGAQSLFWSVDVGREASQQVASAESALQQASLRFSDSQARALEVSASAQGQTREERALRWSYTEDRSATGGFVRQETERLSNSYAAQHLSQNQLQGALGLAGSLGGGAGAGRRGSAAHAQAQAQLESQLKQQY
ncbi:MAG: conjugal transfer protein TraG, partial [Chromatiaceae bacterium]